MRQLTTKTIATAELKLRTAIFGKITAILLRKYCIGLKLRILRLRTREKKWRAPCLYCITCWQENGNLNKMLISTLVLTYHDSRLGANTLIREQFCCRAQPISYNFCYYKKFQNYVNLELAPFFVGFLPSPSAKSPETFANLNS